MNVQIRDCLNYQFRVHLCARDRKKSQTEGKSLKTQNQDFHSRLTFIGFLILRMWIWARCVGGTMIIFLSETLSKYPTTSPILTELRFHRSRHHRPVIQIQITVLPFSYHVAFSHFVSDLENHQRQLWSVEMLVNMCTRHTYCATLRQLVCVIASSRFL